MFPFSQPASPAVSAHLAAQADFFDKLSRSLANSFQHVYQANLQLSQSMLEETMNATRQMWTPHGTEDAPGTVSSRAQPTSETFQAYRQHLSRLATDSHLDLTRITQQHVQETSVTARALADEVAHATSEENARSVRRQQEAAPASPPPSTAKDAMAGKPDSQARAEPRRGEANGQAQDQDRAPQPTQQAGGKHPLKTG